MKSNNIINNKETISSLRTSNRNTEKSTFKPDSNYLSSLPIRKGKWTIEEENYANKIILLFNKGLLPIPSGTTLRSYLSDKLNCDPMRITKKFAGASCIGKVVYQSIEEMASNGITIDINNDETLELQKLEDLFLSRLHGKSLLNNNTTNKSNHNNNNDNKSMKRIVSAPSFSGLSSFAEKSSSDDDEEDDNTTSYDKKSLSRKIGNNKKKLPYIREEFYPKPTVNLHSFRSKKRSQSVMDFMEFEHYMGDDKAAGDLLLKFCENLNESKSKDNWIKTAKQSNIIEAKHLSNAISTTIKQSNSQLVLSSTSSIITTQDNSCNYEIGLNIDDDIDWNQLSSDRKSIDYRYDSKIDYNSISTLLYMSTSSNPMKKSRSSVNVDEFNSLNISD